MRDIVLLIIAFTFSVTLTGCGKSNTPPPVAADKTDKLCAAIKDTGLTKRCIVSNSDSTIGITFDSNDDEMARRLCLDIANRMKPLTADFPGQWQLQVFSPYRDDKPLNYCLLR